MKVKKFAEIIVENQISYIKKMRLDLIRYYGEDNKYTYDLRGGTWFSFKYDERAHRYNQNKSELGGTKLMVGEVKYKNPAVIVLPSSLMIFDAFAFSRIPFFTDEDKDLLFEMIEFKSKTPFLKVVKSYLGLNEETLVYKTIKSIKSLFVIHAIVADLMLSKRLNETSYDILVRVDDEHNIFEVFDFKKMFKETNS